jgi:hypothetical protein
MERLINEPDEEIAYFNRWKILACRAAQDDNSTGRSAISLSNCNLQLKTKWNYTILAR